MTQPSGPQSWPAPTGQLVLNLESTWGSRSMITPQLRINGQAAPVRWGLNEIPVFPGRLDVEITCTYLWEYGRARDTVPVNPDSRVEVYYAAPYFTFLSGRIGPVPQLHRGKLALWLLLIGLAIVVLLVIIGAIAGS
jgi:hypothetical protein